MPAWTTTEIQVLRDNPSACTKRLQVLLPRHTAEAIDQQRTKQGLPLRRRPWTPEEVDRLLELRAAGLTLREVGEMLGRDHTVVHDRLQRERRWPRPR